MKSALLSTSSVQAICEQNVTGDVYSLGSALKGLINLSTLQETVNTG